jgi:hypothetical protein
VALEVVLPLNRLVRVVRSTCHLSAIAFTFGFNSAFISVSAETISFSSNILCVF